MSDFYIEFLCTSYPQCGCEAHSKEKCKHLQRVTAEQEEKMPLWKRWFRWFWG